MPGPPPPPPPSLPQQLFSTTANSKDGRNLLLDSIRKGKTLKKAVTNDRSKPLVSGSSNSSIHQKTDNTVGTRSNISSKTSSTDISNLSNVSNAPGLGGLFVNGIPKLKPTGLAIGQAYQKSRDGNEEERQQVNMNEVASRFHMIDGKNRGPPPQPPPSRMNSNDNNNLSHSSINGHPGTTGYTKPSVAPKPAGIISKPSAPKHNNLGRSAVARAQSMRIARLPTGTPGSSTIESNQSDLHRINNKINLYQSQDSLNNRIGRPVSPSQSGTMTWTSSSNLGTLRSHNRPYNMAPLRPPLSRPPPPPTRAAMNPPMCAPPPPPSQAPPPPPHRTSPAPPPPSTLKKHAQAQLNTSNISNGSPPTPPVRNSSMKSVHGTNKYNSLEGRFSFHKTDEFPLPQPYQNIIKIYNSRIQGKQQAPRPPPPPTASSSITPQLQLLHAPGSSKNWSSIDSSNC